MICLSFWAAQTLQVWAREAYALPFRDTMLYHRQPIALYNL